jgi:hypothetical protein
VLPDYDEERVYPSDIKNSKLVQYAAKGLVVDEEPVIPAEEETPVVEDVEVAAAEKQKIKE